jgi:hypothetical protein
MATGVFFITIEKLQEHVRLKKSVTLLLAAIGALGSPLEPYSESDLATDLYSGSTPIANMDESNHRISFNLLKKYATSLSVMIGALGSPLGPHQESDLATDLYSGSTLIANMDESNRWINFNLLNKFVISLSAAIGALASPLGTHVESDLTTDLYSSSTPIADMEESDCHISFNLLNKFVISLSAAIGPSGSPLGPHPERDLATDLHSGSTPKAIKDDSNHQIRYR